MVRPHKLRMTRYEDSYPQLSSDGSKVVFTSLRQGANGPNSIVVRNAVNPLLPELVLAYAAGVQRTSGIRRSRLTAP